MTNTAYEILAMLDRHFEESVTLLKQLTTRPGQRSDILVPLSNELERAGHWGRIHRRFEEWLKDPDDIYLHVEEREEQRKKKGLAPRAIILPWCYEEEQKLLAVKRAEARKKRKQKPRATASKPAKGAKAS